MSAFGGKADALLIRTVRAANLMRCPLMTQRGHGLRTKGALVAEGYVPLWVAKTDAQSLPICMNRPPVTYGSVIAPLLSRFLRAFFQFSKRAASEATTFDRSGVKLLGVIGATRLECGKPAPESGELSGGSLATTSAISSTFMGRSIVSVGLGLATKGIDRHPPLASVIGLERVSAKLSPSACATPDILRLASQLRCVRGLLGAIPTSHELTVKTSNQGG
jgi:hypothetical protein